MSTKTDLEKLSSLYDTVKLMEIHDIFKNRKMYSRMLCEMHDLLRNEFKRILPKEQTKDFILTHQMLTTVNYIEYVHLESKLRKALAIFDVYMHQIHRYIETGRIEILTTHRNNLDQPLDLDHYEWDDVDKRWEPCLDTIDKVIDRYRDKMMENYHGKNAPNSIYSIFNKIIVRYEARKKRLTEK